MDAWKQLALSTTLAAALYVTGSEARADQQDTPELSTVALHRDKGQWLQALAEIQQLQRAYPDDVALYRLQVLTLADIGNAAMAWKLYQARPQLFSTAQQQRLQAEHLAKRIGWSRAYGASEDSRLDEARQAFSQMQQQDLTSAESPLRIRYDRLLLLNQLGQHDQVRTEYFSLLQDGHPVPGYVLPAVGDSLLASRHPEEAIAVLEAFAPSAQPDDASSTTLAYAYLESNQPQRALDWSEHWRDEQPAYLRQPGARQSYQNWPRYEADSTLQMVRAYSGDLPTAQHALEQLTDSAPANDGLLSSLGMVYQMRGWPRRALEYQQMAHTLDPREMQPRVGQYEAWVELQRDDLARPLHDDVYRLYPNHPMAQRMHRHWRAHRGWQLTAFTGAGHSSGGNSPFGNRDRHSGLEVQSPVIADRWRLVAFVDRRSADYASRTLDPLRLGGGVRYRYGPLDADLLLDHADDRIGGTGAAMSLGWQFNDYWRAGAHITRNDAQASLQARAFGISANSGGAELQYRHSERTLWELSADRFHYDDGNRRDLLASSLTQRLFTRPKWHMDGLGNAYLGRASRIDRPYFNPRRDGLGEFGIRIQHQPWQRYERHFQQQLTLAMGDYWQRDHGTAWVPRAEYRHLWQVGLGRSIEYGISWSRPVYDGRREQHIGLDAVIRWGE